jgi:hypothetical protein
MGSYLGNLSPCADQLRPTRGVLGKGFPADTLTVSGDMRVRKIEALFPGMRMLTLPPVHRAWDESPFGPHTRIEPLEWRLLHMRKDYDDGNSVEAWLLRPLSWFEQHGDLAANSVCFDDPALGAVGRVRVLNVEQCPAVENCRGQLVTGFMKQQRCQLLRIRFAGAITSLKVTPDQALWSVHRDGWISAGELKREEWLYGLTVMAMIDSIDPPDEAEPVFNIEVDGDQCYRAGPHEVLAEAPVL